MATRKKTAKIPAKKKKRVITAKNKKRGLKKAKKPFKKIPAAKRAKKKAKKKKKEGMSSKIFDPRKLEMFLEKGRERNFVTYSEIMSFFPEVEKDIDGLDELYQMLDARGIEVKEAREFLEIGEKIVKRRLESKIDPVQMYLKEIGQIGALTAHDEKDRSGRF